MHVLWLFCDVLVECGALGKNKPLHASSCSKVAFIQQSNLIKSKITVMQGNELANSLYIVLKTLFGRKKMSALSCWINVGKAQES